MKKNEKTGYLDAELIGEVALCLQKDLISATQTINSIKATLIVNFGPNGRRAKVINDTDRNVEFMIIDVIEWYNNQLEPKTI